MWNKNVDIDPISVVWEGQAKYKTPPGAWYLRDEPGLQNALAPELEKAYQAVMAKAWVYLDPEEMTVVKNQAMEVKEKTRFGAQ